MKVFIVCLLCIFMFVPTRGFAVKGYEGIKIGMTLSQVKSIVTKKLNKRKNVVKRLNYPDVLNNPAYQYFVEISKVNASEEQKNYFKENSESYWTIEPENYKALDYVFLNDSLMFIIVEYGSSNPAFKDIKAGNFILSAIQQLGEPAGFESYERFSNLKNFLLSAKWSYCTCDVIDNINNLSFLWWFDDNITARLIPCGPWCGISHESWEGISLSDDIYTNKERDQISRYADSVYLIIYNQNIADDFIKKARQIDKEKKDKEAGKLEFK